MKPIVTHDVAGEDSRELTDQEVEAECHLNNDYGVGCEIVVALAREVRAQRQRNGTWKFRP